LASGKQEIIDLQPLTEWVLLYSQGSVQTKIELLFRMYGVGELMPVNRIELEALLKILLTPCTKYFNFDEHQIPELIPNATEFIRSMMYVFFVKGEIQTDNQGKIRPNDFLKWLSGNDYFIEMLERCLLQNAKQSGNDVDNSESGNSSRRRSSRKYRSEPREMTEEESAETSTASVHILTSRRLKKGPKPQAKAEPKRSNTEHLIESALDNSKVEAWKKNIRIG